MVFRYSKMTMHYSARLLSALSGGSETFPHCSRKLLYKIQENHQLQNCVEQLWFNMRGNLRTCMLRVIRKICCIMCSLFSPLLQCHVMKHVRKEILNVTENSHNKNIHIYYFQDTPTTKISFVNSGTIEHKINTQSRPVIHRLMCNV